MRALFLLLPVLAACAGGPGADPARPAPKRAPAKTEEDYSDERPVPLPTAEEREEFNRIWELFRRNDPRWPLERDRFRRRSDAAGYVLAGHLLQFYMLANLQRERAAKELVRAKNEIVAVGEPCVPALIDLMVKESIPLRDGRAFLTDDITRMDCVDMLERTGAPAVPYLLAALERGGMPEKGRRLTALALGGTRDERAYGPLVRLLREDASWQVRADAATGLAKLGDRRAVQPLAEAVKKDPDPAVAKRAAKARADLLKQRASS